MNLDIPQEMCSLLQLACGFRRYLRKSLRCKYELVHNISHSFTRIYFLNLVLSVGQFTVGNLFHVLLSLRNPVNFYPLFFILLLLFLFYFRPLLIFILSRSKTFYSNSLVYHFSTLNGSSEIFKNCEVQNMSVLQLFMVAV